MHSHSVSTVHDSRRDGRQGALQAPIRGSPVSLPMKDFLDGPTSTGSPSSLNSPSRLRISSYAPRFPKANAGVDHDFLNAFFLDFRHAITKKAFRSATTSP